MTTAPFMMMQLMNFRKNILPQKMIFHKHKHIETHTHAASPFPCHTANSIFLIPVRRYLASLSSVRFSWEYRKLSNFNANQKLLSAIFLLSISSIPIYMYTSFIFHWFTFCLYVCVYLYIVMKRLFNFVFTVCVSSFLSIAFGNRHSIHSDIDTCTFTYSYTYASFVIHFSTNILYIVEVTLKLLHTDKLMPLLLISSCLFVWLV